MWLRRIEQRILGDRAGRDDAHDVALDHRLAAALLGLGRVFDLLADGDLEALADQAREIGLVAVDRHAAHRDVLARVLAALGERDVEGRGGLHRVVEEQLVEVAHAVEQQAVGMGRLDRQVLRHHRRTPPPSPRRRGAGRFGSGRGRSENEGREVVHGGR